MTFITDESRRLGVVLGFLAGDALGAPFHAVKGAHIRQLLGRAPDDYLANPVLFPDRPDKNHLPGLHTCAGQEFLAILAGGADDGGGRAPLARAAAYLADLSSGGLRAPGRPLRRAIERWKRDYPWELADHFAPEEPSEGAASCARGIAAWLVGADPVYAARLTHLREPSLAAAWTLSEAARLLASQEIPKRLEADALLREIIAGCRACEDRLREGPVGEHWHVLKWGRPRARMSDALAPLASLLREGNDELAEKTLLHQAREFAPAHDVAHVQHGFAPVLVPWVLYRALGPLGASQAVEDAIGRGGEAPLAAGLIGALMGARYGVDAFPPEWIEGLRSASIARELSRAPSNATAQAWLAEERRWTAGEEAFREPLRREAEKTRAATSADRNRTRKRADTAPPPPAQGELPFAPPPQVWLEALGDQLAPWEKQRLKAERGRKRIEWKETRREKKRRGPEKE